MRCGSTDSRSISLCPRCGGRILGYDYVPEPTAAYAETIQETITEENAYKFTKPPKRIHFGSVAVCPRCHARTQRYKFKNKEDKLHGDPVKDKTPCIGCNGWGFVPNVGPIPMSEPK